MRRLVISFLFALVSACGPGGIGQQCFGGPEGNDCVEDAICTQDTDHTSIEMTGAARPGPTSFCRKRCDVNADCDMGFTCQGVPTTFLASCQPGPSPAP